MAARELKSPATPEVARLLKPRTLYPYIQSALFEARTDRRDESITSTLRFVLDI